RRIDRRDAGRAAVAEARVPEVFGGAPEVPRARQRAASDARRMDLPELRLRDRSTRAGAMSDGRRVVVSSLGRDPMDALDRCTTLEPMAPPDPAALGARDVIIAIASAQVGWVDLLMTSDNYQHHAAPPYTPGLEYAG